MEQYKKMMSEISPSKDLIEDTKNKMKGGDFKMSKKSIIILAAALVLIIAAGAIIIPNITENSEVPYDGPLVFQDGAGAGAMQKLFFDPATTHEEMWTEAQVFSYLGSDFRPSFVPAGLSISPQSEYFIILTNDGTMAYGVFGAYYFEDGNEEMDAKRLSIAVSKDALPITCTIYPTDKSAEINGVSVKAGSVTNEFGTKLYADFIYNGIGYTVTGDNLSEKDFSDVVLSIIK